MAANSPPPLHPRIRSLLANLRSRIRRYITVESLLAGLLVVLGTFWVGLVLDRVPVSVGGTEMPRSARIVLLVIGGVLLVVVAVRLFFGRIFRRLPDDTLALLLERHHPRLQGRLVTAVQLNRPRQTGDLHSAHLLERVHHEAAERAAEVDTGRVLRMRPLVIKAAVAVPLVLGLVALAVTSPRTMRQAFSRLVLLDNTPWPREADLRMVGVEVPLVTPTEQPGGDAARLLPFEDQRVRVARGGAATLRVQALADGAVVPEICTVYYETASGVRGQTNMRRVGRVRDGFQSFALDGPPLSGITEDITLSVRGLDDRLDDYVIEAVEPPGIAALTVQAAYPSYLRPEGAGESPDMETRYQPGLRLREGSTVRLVGRASAPLANVQAAVSRGDASAEVVAVDVAAGGLEFSLDLVDLREPTTVVMVPLDADEISSPSPYRYFLGIVNDAPPDVRIRLRGIGSAVTPQVRIPIEGTAADDYGVLETAIHLAPVADDPAPAVTIAARPDREGQFQAEIDTRDLTNAGRMPPLEPGTAWNLYAEARDAYDLGTPHVVRTDLMRMDVVTPEELLAVLERRELGLRSRLEQTITETQTLRDSLDLLRREGWVPTGDAAAESATTAAIPAPLQQEGEEEPNVDRGEQLLRLRIQQAELQAAKTIEEISGIANSIDDILLEMVNNRIDTPDRRERIASGVRDPLRDIVSGPLGQLRDDIHSLTDVVGDPTTGPRRAAVTVQRAEEVLLSLTAVLEKMLDLESYNEVLDLVRGLIDNQEELIEATESERAQALQELFEGFE